eukprot:9527999-Heterocapsa_arctica.AAC.1
MGFIAPEDFKLLGYLSPSAGLRSKDVPNGLAVIGKVPVSRSKRAGSGGSWDPAGLCKNDDFDVF